MIRYDLDYKKELTVENMVREYYTVMKRGNGAEERVREAFMLIAVMGFVSVNEHDKFWSTVSGWEYKDGEILDDDGNVVNL